MNESGEKEQLVEFLCARDVKKFELAYDEWIAAEESKRLVVLRRHCTNVATQDEKKDSTSMFETMVTILNFLGNAQKSST